MLAVWIAAVVVGMGVAIAASRRAVSAATELGRAIGLSPFAIGVTIVAVGTDLPEVANSLIASFGGHGDLNVGDSIGSVVTQSTVVMGLTCFAGVVRADRRNVVTTGTLTVLALAVAAALFADQRFDRLDGAILIALWVAGTIVIQPPLGRRPQPEGDVPMGPSLARTLGWLLGVALGAALTVEGFIRAAELMDAPEFLSSFFVLALGTSLPELVIAARAVRQSAAALALGDLLGSSFVDATLSPGIGPLLFPTSLSPDVSRSVLIVAMIVAVATAVLARSRVHRWSTGITLLLLYLVLYPALIV